MLHDRELLSRVISGWNLEMEHELKQSCIINSKKTSCCSRLAREPKSQASGEWKENSQHSDTEENRVDELTEWLHKD